MSNYIYTSDALDAVKKQQDIYKKLFESPVLDAIEKQKELYYEIFEPIRQQQKQLQESFSKALTIQIDLSPSINAINDLLKLSNVYTVTSNLSQTILEFSNTLDCVKEISVDSLQNSLETFGRTLSQNKDFYENHSEDVCYEMDHEISSLVTATEGSLSSIQEYVPIEQYQELQLQIDTLKQQIQNIESKVEKDNLFNKVMSIIMFLITIFSVVHSINSSEESNMYYQQFLDSQQQIERSLENIEKKLDSQEQPHDYSSESKE